MSSAKRLLIGLIVLGALAGVVGGVSFATFTAQTTNPTNTFSTGTLVLSDQKDTGTACLSTGGGNSDTNSNSTGCEDLIAAGASDTSTTHTVTVKNEGSIAASAFELWSASCTTSDAPGESFHGTGDACGLIQLTIHDDTNNTCYYPTTTFGIPASGACTLTSGKTLSDFASNANSSHIALKGDGTNNGLGAGSNVVFTVQTSRATAGNTLQGRRASLDFTWKITQ